MAATMINVNMGRHSWVEAVLPVMRERKSGTINDSSVADRNARTNAATYKVTKKTGSDVT